MTDNEIIKAWDILCKFDFFGGQRAGRELWNEKPTDIQDKDIETFSRDVAFLKDFINRQKAEIENYSHNNKNMTKDIRKLQKSLEQAKAEAERLKKAKVIYSTVDYCEGDLTEALRENERLKAEIERYKQALRNAEQYCHSLVKEMGGEADGRGHKDDCCQSQNENNAQ